MAGKKKLDVLLVERQLADTREEAQSLIESGVVQVNGIVRRNKAGQYEQQARITFVKERKYVSRGGYKLEGALKAFSLNVRDEVCLDIGSSTGGFTDCLLQGGAKRVYAVDVGYGILDWKLRQDKRVVLLERTNARKLTYKKIGEWIDLCVIDASFISLNLLIEQVVQFFKEVVSIIALVKPQFQLPREKVTPGGVITDSLLHDEAIQMVSNYAETLGLRVADTAASPLCGAKGNQEFFLLLRSAEGIERRNT
ncbi:MAG: TlyA family rRNA (cytidine-2'-O)-methyltransferase [Desulfobulbus propionicus]|nr:MAG: TlyA family rRNA (cytidine-2'-O)-methyltransferase [Desulfobulbus propionicus]